MMNVGIIFYAARETGDRQLRDIAMRHSLTTRRVLVRGDGSTAHEGIFDTDTGEFLQQTTHQGYRGDSCWSRGLAWALYGFTTCYEYSRDPHFLETAEACADFYITHSPADGVPPWDFNAPAENRTLLDTSAGGDRGRGTAAAVPPGSGSDEGPLLLVDRRAHSALAVRKASGASPIPSGKGFSRAACITSIKNLGVDESVMWGEYFFVEALGAGAPADASAKQGRREPGRLTDGSDRLLVQRGVVIGTGGEAGVDWVPMMSPETTSSTRRLR